MAYAPWSVVFGEQPSASKWNILGTNDAGFNAGSAFAAGALGSDNASLATGMVRQIVSTNSTAGATGTTTMPYDDTIPQITEGTEFMTQAITPKSTTNRLSIEATLLLSASTTDHICVALFQDATANALAANTAYQATATGAVNLKVTHDMVAGTTSATTFRVRAGTNAAGTTTFNGQSAGRRFGGITVSNIKITEYKG